MHPKQPYTEVPYRIPDADPAPGMPSGVHRTATDLPEESSKTHETVAETPAESSASEQAPAWYKEAHMLKRVVTIVVIVVLAFAAYQGYLKWKANRDVASGDIYSDDLTPGSRTRSGEVSTATAIPKSGTPSASTQMLAMPTTDSQSANAPNGATFSGTGKFQVYRQGNLTWRVNTETGESCVLFATEEEWHKSIVYNHGCSTT